MIVGIGTDIVEIQRIKNVIENNTKFLERVYTDKELDYAVSDKKIKYNILAGMWAAKEAFAKATGKGFRSFSLKDVEVLHNELGKPYLDLYNVAFVEAGGTNVHISISHSEITAVAYCIIEKCEVNK